MSGTLEKAKGDSLALLNIVRQSFQQEPLNDLPRATPGHSNACLYAMALKDSGVTGVSGSGDLACVSERVAQRIAALFGTEAHGNVVKTPAQFGQVIPPFDGHRMPEYNPARDK